MRNGTATGPHSSVGRRLVVHRPNLIFAGPVTFPARDVTVQMKYLNSTFRALVERSRRENVGSLILLQPAGRVEK